MPIDETTLRSIIDLILYRRQKTPWSVLGEQFALDLANAAYQASEPIRGMDPESATRCDIAAELWKLYGPGRPYVADEERAGPPEAANPKEKP